MNLMVTVCKCSYCKGKGWITVSSHDCWGKSGWDERPCSMCRGNGFTIDPESAKKIRKELKL